MGARKEQDDIAIPQTVLDEFFQRNNAVTEDEKMTALLRACFNTKPGNAGKKQGKFKWKP